MEWIYAFSQLSGRFLSYFNRQEQCREEVEAEAGAVAEVEAREAAVAVAAVAVVAVAARPGHT